MTNPPSEDQDNKPDTQNFADKAGNAVTQTITVMQDSYKLLATNVDQRARRSSREIIVTFFFGLISITSLIIFINLPEPKPTSGDFLINIMTELLGLLIFYVIFYIALREIASLDAVEMESIEKRLDTIEQKLDYIIQLHDSNQNNELN